jgi:3-oxocholest-4-en-26-oyl-CoA dehydrogenase beta subunit
MDFSLSEAQTEIAALARKILAEQDAPQRQWADLAAAGVLAAGLPEALGGAGLDFVEQCSVLAETGRAVSRAPYLWSAVLGAGAIAAFGSAEQRRRWAAPAADGSTVLTVALEEEDGDDLAAPSVLAEHTGGGWRLSGVKTAVPALPQADLVLVTATAPATGEVLVFLVAPSDPGVTTQPQELTDGRYDPLVRDSGANDTGGAGAGRLALDGVPLDASRVLGEPGQGREVAGWLVSRATVGLCAVQAGVVSRALELTAEYARSREQFGRPIGSFQAVAQRLADAYIDVQAVWLTMWQAAWLLATRPPGNAEGAAAVATAKFWAADAGHRVAHTAVHVHGGTGIDTSYPVHRYFTAAKRAEFSLGGATAQLVRLGDLLAAAE